uniref:BPL/LPL catalytic domain-containing protein n=1 Tax=Meloidogyne javanica TaxID=6303 RepID=A0A915LRE8_MELJA
MFEHNPPAYTVGIREGIYTEETERKVVGLGAEFHRVKRGEQVLIQMLKEKFKLENLGRTENAGVWINEQKKIGAIGIQVRNGITSHGLALNCETDLK